MEKNLQKDNTIKETLVQLFAKNFTEMHRSWRTVLTIYGFMLLSGVLTVKFLIGDYTDYQKQIIPLTNAQLKIEAENERRKTKYNDSIAFIEAQKQTARAFKVEGEIQAEADRLHRLMPNCSAVNYWSIHNHGKPFEVDGKWLLEVYTSSSTEVEQDFKMAPPPIFRGLRWLGRELNKHGQLYFGDVTIYEELYWGKTKTTLDLNGTKSFVCEYVKNKGNQFLYVSFDFTIKDPEKDIPDLKKKMRDFARFVRVRT